MVEWMEKDLHTEIEVQLLRCLKSRGLRPSDVKAVKAVVGGDHSDTAFQFGAAITAEMHVLDKHRTTERQNDRTIC